jgi:gluconokinase
MKIPGLRSSYEMVSGVIFFGRMLDKIRLHERSCLPSDYNRGKGFDGRTCRFLHIDYEKLVSRVLQGGTDDEILKWCYEHGRRPSEEEIFVWNAFMSKRGWRDDVSEWLAEQKRSRGWERRHDIETAFDFHVADETES